MENLDYVELKLQNYLKDDNIPVQISCTDVGLQWQNLKKTSRIVILVLLAHCAWSRLIHRPTVFSALLSRIM